MTTIAHCDLTDEEQQIWDTTANAVLTGDARQIWETDYKPVPELIATKLKLGHLAFEKSLTDSGSLRVLDKLTELYNNSTTFVPSIHRAVKDSTEACVRTQTEKILAQLTTNNAVEQVKSRLTLKGKVFEEEVAAMLSEESAITSATVIRERDANNKQGGDIIVQDISQNHCVIETKAKQNITAEDLIKFERDADAWNGVPSLFAFLVQGGIGSCRKLQEKGLFEKTAGGRTMLYFRGNETEFVAQLPVIMALHGKMSTSTTTDNGHQVLLSQVAKTLSAERKAIDSDILDQESVKAHALKRLGSLRKRSAAVAELLESVNAHSKEPETVKIRLT